MLDIVVELESASGSSGMVSYSFTSSCAETIGINLNPESASTWVDVNTNTFGKVKFTTREENEHEEARECSATPIVNNTEECDDKVFKVKQKGKEIPKCIIQVIAVGDAQGCINTTFTCNGESGTTGIFVLPITESGGTITVNPPSDCKATPISGDVRCGETMQTEIDRIQKVNVVISSVSQTGYIDITVDAADNEPVDIGLKVHCTDTEGHQSFIETGVTLYCTGAMQTIRVTPPSTADVNYAEITGATFPETETDELCNSGSYICYKLQY